MVVRWLWRLRAPQILLLPPGYRFCLLPPPQAHPLPAHLYLSASHTKGAWTIMTRNRGTARVKVQAANTRARTLATVLLAPAHRVVEWLLSRGALGCLRPLAVLGQQLTRRACDATPLPGARSQDAAMSAHAMHAPPILPAVAGLLPGRGSAAPSAAALHSNGNLDGRGRPAPLSKCLAAAAAVLARRTAGLLTAA